MYVVDADVFIQAHRRHYGLDFAPGFWEWLERQHAAGHLISVEKVRQEIEAGDDELARWVAARRSLFVAPDAATLRSLRLLATWTQTAGLPYTQAAVATFLGSGDYQLVAHAHAHGLTVVTHEAPAPGSKNRIKIPDVCAAVQVRCTDPFTVLRTEAARLVLSP